MLRTAHTRQSVALHHMRLQPCYAPPAAGLAPASPQWQRCWSGCTPLMRVPSHLAERWAGALSRAVEPAAGTACARWLQGC